MENEENLATPTSSSNQFNTSDWFLQTLVGMSNNSDVSFSITLNVGGVLVSGELIGGEEYFNGFANDLKMAGLPANAADLFKKFGDIYVKQREQKEANQDDNTIPPPQYIHLKNARIFHPGGNPIPTNRGVWWRGRLDAVDGFILGSLSAGR